MSSSQNQYSRNFFREVQPGERGLPPRRKINRLTFVPVTKRELEEEMLQLYTKEGQEIVSGIAKPGISPSAYISRFPGVTITEEDENATPLGEEFLDLGEPAETNSYDELWRRLGVKYRFIDNPVQFLSNKEQFKQLLEIFGDYTNSVISFYELVLNKAGATAEHFKYYQDHEEPLQSIFKTDIPKLKELIKDFLDTPDTIEKLNILQRYFTTIQFFKTKDLFNRFTLVNPFLLHKLYNELLSDYKFLLKYYKKQEKNTAELMTAVNSAVGKVAAERAASRSPLPGFLPRVGSRSPYPGNAQRGEEVGEEKNAAAAAGGQGSPVPFFRSPSNAAAAARRRAAEELGEEEGENGNMTPGMSPLPRYSPNSSPVPATGPPFSPRGMIPLIRSNYEFGGGARFWPPKYYRGLSRRAKLQRKREITRRAALGWKNPAAYKDFTTNRGIQTRRSSYTAEWDRLFPDVKSLEARAKATGVPVEEIRESYNRGLAAWRTGHRPGATQQQWGYARVSSFLLCGKTHFTTDSDLVRRAKQRSAAARAWWVRCRRQERATRRAQRK